MRVVVINKATGELHCPWKGNGVVDAQTVAIAAKKRGVALIRCPCGNVHVVRAKKI